MFRCSKTLRPWAALVAGLILAPAAGAQDKPGPVTAAQVRKSQNNLKQIGLAMINYADTYRGTMPNNVYDKSAKPLLSWRVLILPYIEEANLYKEFHLDEPWDSDHNKKLVARMPKTFGPIRVKVKDGETFYQGFVGEKAVFGPKNRLRFPASFTDGTSNTALVFEAGESIIWTKPDELVYDDNKPLPKLGGLFDGEFNVCLADGSVRRCKKDADEKELRKLIMPADGLVIDLGKLWK
jgi:hypothetical protein